MEGIRGMAMNLGTAHPVAKKKHRCESCGGAIQPGDRYVRARVVDGGEAWVWKSHDDCQAASQILYDQGFDNDGMLICVSDMDDELREIVAVASASLAERLWPAPPTIRRRRGGEG
jgi:predicted RNA-binding Zn-ribbon protein involved in translation (DUF1610 family)